VILTARNAADGAAAAKAIGADFHALDVTDPASIAALADWLRAGGQGVDVLINNAAVAVDGFNAEVARKTIDANVYGPLRVTAAVLPFIPDGGTIVMVSSGVGELSGLAGPIRRELTSQNLTTDKLMALMEAFVTDVTEERHREAGWPSSAYRLSKAGLNALTRLLAVELAPRRIKVNAVCPGWVRTRMGGQTATRGIVEGAKSILWAATLPADGPTGGFFRDGRKIQW
jgi:NAD(P)-dependent dehydrogenase (short-subunit alcohol dehydrogenase family)